MMERGTILADQLTHIARGVVDVALPPRCLICRVAVEHQGQLCPKCFQNINFITLPYCNFCGVPLSAAMVGAASMCPACRGTPPQFSRARAALRYDRLGRRLILPLKHIDRMDLAGMLASHMVRTGRDVLESADLLVPVPLQRWRMFRRGYNQAALLASAIADIAGIRHVPNALLRTRRTVSLGNKSAAERSAIVQDAFAISPARKRAISGRAVVLVDDVMTSGATANACTSALIAGGARSVDVLVAARVPDPRIN